MMFRWIFCSLILCLTNLAFCQISFADKACSQAVEKRIASFNIHQESWMDLPKYWRFRADAIQQVLRKLEADVIHLQEVSEDRYPALQKALPQFQLWASPGGLVTFVRNSAWTVVRHKTLVSSDEVAVQELQLLDHESYDHEVKILWNVWLRPRDWKKSTVSDQLSQLLETSLERPTFISMSLRAPDRLHHDRAAWHQLLRRHNLRQADPQTFAITTNGWWATKWTTQDWHDTILSQRTQSLAKADIIREKTGGTYPSTHFPLVTHYCPKRELIVEQFAE